MSARDGGRVSAGDGGQVSAPATGRPGHAVPPPAPLAPAARARVWLRAYGHHLRLLRAAAITWIVVLAGVGAGVVHTFEDRVGTEAERRALEAMEGVPVFELLSGRYVQIGAVEGFTLSRWGMFALGVAVWGVTAGVGLLRGAEDAGHVEPLRVGLITPRALFVAALAALLTTHAIFAVAIGLGHSKAGMDGATAWALGASMGLLATSFALAGALASQVAASRSRALALAAIVFALALALRFAAAAGGTPDWFWWTTPFGWVGHLHAVDEARAQVVLAFLSLITVLLMPALWLARRDLHAGLVSAEARRQPRASPRDHVALARHLATGPTAAWSAAAAALALLFGLLVSDFLAAMAGLPTSVQFLEQLGWLELDTAEGTLAMVFMFPTLLLALFAATHAAAIREEEASWRIEHLLARPLGRTRWLLTKAFTAALSMVVVALCAAFAAWLGTLLSGTALAPGAALLMALNLMPLGLLILGIGVGLLGLAPRLTAPVTFGVVVVAFLLDFIGPLLNLHEAILDLSPFRHLAAVPAEPIALGPALVLLAIGVGAAALGLLAFRHRDLQAG